MLASEVRGNSDSAIFFLHFLGGSAQEWQAVEAHLDQNCTCIAIDLPGFGASSGLNGFSVGQMADAVANVIANEARSRWMIVGHSMGAKVAAVVARRAEEGATGLTGLAGLVLVAGSPPSPEPMAESRRERMMTWFAGPAAESTQQAEDFIEANVAQSLPPESKQAAIADVLRMDRAAWLAWLESGSREDWAATVGVLRTPALIVAGEKDEDLGPDAQQSLMLPHFANGRVEVLAGAKHLLPLERPDELAQLIQQQWATEPSLVTASPVIDAAYQSLIDSDRVSSSTRKALMSRGKPNDPAYQPQSLTAVQLARLRAVVARVIPQNQGDGTIDLAARIDQQLAKAEGDGWRYAILPVDVDAYRIGLETLDQVARDAYGQPFIALQAEQQDNLLAEIAAPSLIHRTLEAVTPQRDNVFNGKQMTSWFEELRADAVKVYVAHPATLARMGYSGIADGADANTAHGFVQVGLGRRESWEPEAKEVDAR